MYILYRSKRRYLRYLSGVYRNVARHSLVVYIALLLRLCAAGTFTRSEPDLSQTTSIGFPRELTSVWTFRCHRALPIFSYTLLQTILWLYEFLLPPTILLVSFFSLHSLRTISLIGEIDTLRLSLLFDRLETSVVYSARMLLI